MKIALGNKGDRSLSASDILELVLSSRGIRDAHQRELYLAPPSPELEYLIQETGLSRPALVQTKTLLEKAFSEGQDILIFGDYDADGLTASAIMWKTLSYLARASKARVMPFIPDRHHHGYGLSEKALKDIMSGDAFKDTAYPDFSPHLIITVDNGIVAVQAVELLKQSGISVVITDHHQIDVRLPPADCIVHSTVTSGAGVAWITALYLSNNDPSVKDLVGLATIGIVADQMKLLGVNRAIVVEGLQNLASTKNHGLRELVQLAGIGDKALTAYDINFVIAPRLNAVGRLGNPVDGLRLLCTTDLGQAKNLANLVNTLNQSRQQVTQEGITHALQEKVEHKIIISYSPDYHEGVIGLIAGKLAEKYSRPALAISLSEVGKGSARSVEGVNITELLRQFSDLFLSVGGHEQAAGFSFEPARIEEIRDTLYNYADQNIDESLLEKTLHPDLELSLKQAGMTLAELFKKLEPYGMGNPKPTFLARDLTVIEDRILGQDGTHRKFVVEQEGTTRQVIWFNAASEVTKDERIVTIKELIFTLDINSWNGRDSVQLVAQYVRT